MGVFTNFKNPTVITLPSRESQSMDRTREYINTEQGIKKNKWNQRVYIIQSKESRRMDGTREYL